MNSALKISPRNLLEWSNMEDWVSGASAAPTEHTLSGASATVAQESTIIKQGTYSAKVTRVGTDCMIYHDLATYASYLGRQMTFGCWCYATVASRVRISISDGVGSSTSSFHSGGSSWEYLTVTRNIDTSATRIRVQMEVVTGNTSGYFDGGILIEGPTTFTDLSSYLEEWKPGQRFRLSKFVAARRPGVITPASEIGEKTLALSGKVFGTTATAARTSFDAMFQSLIDGEKDLYLYDDRFMRGYLESEDHDYIAALRCMKFNLRFHAQRPFNYFLQRLRKQQAISATPTTFTVTNNGNVYSNPIIQFVSGVSTLTAFSLENLTTGQIMTYNGTVVLADILKVDCEEITVENDGVDDVSNFVGDFIKLAPGDNQIKYTGANCTIKVDSWDRWLS